MNVDVQERSIEERYRESVIQKSILMFIWAVLTAVLLQLSSSDSFYLIAGIISVIIFIIIIRQKLTKERRQAYYSWVCLLCIIFVGTALGHYLTLVTLASAVIAVSIIDILSFTRYGKRTVNAKLMANKEQMYKLVVYGISLNTKQPVPTKGYGDFLFYTIASSSVCVAYNFKIALGALFCIYIGDIINSVVVGRIYRKTWYKGFPAIFIPLGFCLIYLLIIFLVIK